MNENKPNFKTWYISVFSFRNSCCRLLLRLSTILALIVQFPPPK